MHFFGFLHFFVRFCAFFIAKMACRKAQILRRIVQKCTHKKRFYAIPTFSYTPLCVISRVGILEYSCALEFLFFRNAQMSIKPVCPSNCVSPPRPRKSVNFEDFSSDLYSFSSFLDPFQGGVKPNFADKNFICSWMDGCFVSFWFGLCTNGGGGKGFFEDIGPTS